MSGIAVRARGLTRDFGSLRAVDALDLEVPERRIFGFLGPNGCGKTTAMRLLTGLITPTAGSAEVLGLEVPAQAEALRQRVGYMTQRFSLYEDLTADENLAFVADVHGLTGDRRASRLAEVRERYELDELDGRRAGQLSGGQKQRMALAAAVLHEPELLLLDEPTSAVDPESRRMFWEGLFDLTAEGVTVLVSTHFMDEAERCHEIVILDEGRLVASGPPAVLTGALTDRVVRVRADDPRACKLALIADPQVLSAAQLGLDLRVVLRPGVSDPAGHLAGLIQRAGIRAESEAIDPNLEDVFVVATRGELEAAA